MIMKLSMANIYQKNCTVLQKGGIKSTRNNTVWMTVFLLTPPVNRRDFISKKPLCINGIYKVYLRYNKIMNGLSWKKNTRSILKLETEIFSNTKHSKYIKQYFKASTKIQHGTGVCKTQ